MDMMLEARAAGGGDVQLQDIKEEEDVELTRLNSDATSESQRSVAMETVGKEHFQEELGKEVVVVTSGGGSRDDLSLLPPLPNAIERVVDQDDVEAGPVAPELHDAVPDAGSQFDLSKALEIPVSFGAANGETSTINNTGSHSDSSLSLTPLITSPKLSLKKKFSTVTPEGSPNDTLEMRGHAGVRNRSNSNVAAFQHILPALNMALDASSYDQHHHHHLLHQPQVPLDRKSIRKFSFGDSSSLCTSNNSLSETELLYKVPPPLLSGQSRSRSYSNPMEGSNTPNSSILENESSPKKLPLLRRASSAILRKTSLRSNGNKDILRSSSASVTPVLHSRPVFDSEVGMSTPPRGAKSSRSLFEPGSDEELLYVTPLHETPEGTLRNPSIRSRVRRGFSRIMSSSGSMRRVASSASSVRDVPQGHEPEPSSHARPAPLSTAMKNSNYSRVELGRNSVASSKNSSPTEARRSVSNPLATPMSASTAMTPTTSRTQLQGETIDQRGRGVARASGLDYIEQSSGAMERTDGKRINQDEKTRGVADTVEDDVTVDLDKLTQSIPIITVTDKLGSRDCTAIHLQSNIVLDEVYNGKNYKNDKRYIGSTRDKREESNKPEMMTLSEYTSVLMKQQQIEDERLAALENNFRESGWCSNDDLMNLKQKRIMISKKWAERISFYQNKLDS